MTRKKLFMYVLIVLTIVGVTSIAYALIEDLTINPNVTISPGKTMLTVSGMVTCPAEQSLIYLDIMAFQQRGNRQTSGTAELIYWDPYGMGGQVWDCTGSPMPWAVTILAGDGLWQPGPVSVRVSAGVCEVIYDEWGWENCAEGSSGSTTIDARLHAGQ